MEWFFIILLVLGVPLWLVIWLIVRVVRAGNRIEELSRRLGEVELEVFQLKQKRDAAPSSGPEANSAFTSESVASQTETAPKSSDQTAASPSPATQPLEEFPAHWPSTPPPPAAPPIATPPPIPVFASKAATPLPSEPAFVSEPPTQSPPAAEEIFSPKTPPPVPENGSFEMRLGTYWLVRVGIVMLLTGLVFFGNYAYHNFIGKLGPGGKISLLYLASAALLGLGAWWQRKAEKPAMRNYAQVLFAGGLAAVYFTTYAAHHIEQLRVIQSAVFDGALLLVWAGFMAWMADRRKSEVLALFAVGLAYYTSAITRVGSFTLYSNLVLTLVAVVFLIRNRWAGLSFASLVATYAGYAFWRFFHGGDWRWASPDEGLWFGAYFLMSYWLVFTTAVFLSKHEKLSGWNRAAFLTLNNGAFYSLFLLTMFQVRTGGFWKFTLVCGVVLLALAELSRRLLPAEAEAKNAYLTQGLLLVTVGIVAKFSGMQLALMLAAESVILFVLGSQRSLVMKIGAFIAGAMAVGSCVSGLVRFDTAGLWLGCSVGALMTFNALWAHRQRAEDESLFRFVPGYFAILALVVWLGTTGHNTAEGMFPLVLAVEAVVLTFSIYLLRVREITLLAQFYLLIAQIVWLVRTVDSTVTAPWWHHAVVIGISLLMSHWWQRQTILSRGVQMRSAWQGIYALAVVCVLYFWLSDSVSAQVWLALSAGLAVAVTAYGVATRAWLLAACGQLLLVASGLHFAVQLSGGKPEWYLPLVPVAALAVLSFATVRWFGARPDADSKVRDPLIVLARVYRCIALVMIVCWVFKYVAEREQIWVFMALGLLVFLFAGWKKNREALVFGGVFSALSVACIWARCMWPELICWPNLVAILVLLAQQQFARRLPERFAVPAGAQSAAVVIGGLTLWLFVSRWVMRDASGFYLTASWSGLALALFACGMALRERMYRWLGLGILAAALGRVIIFDVWKLKTIYMVLSFITLGVVLLVLGFLYNKFQETIRKWL